MTTNDGGILSILAPFEALLQARNIVWQSASTEYTANYKQGGWDVKCTACTTQWVEKLPDHDALCVNALWHQAFCEFATMKDTQKSS